MIQEKNIIHLMRGKIFDIAGTSFFTFGGEYSIDKMYRAEAMDYSAEMLYEEIKELYGRIEIIDAYGTFGQTKEVLYDIMGADNILYKHIPESDVESLNKDCIGE